MILNNLKGSMILRLIKFILIILILCFILIEIPANTKPGTFLHTHITISYLQVIITIVIIISCTLLVQSLFNRQQIADIRKDLYTDVLTGLLNRRALDRELKLAIDQARSESKSVSLIFIDIDQFKAINSSLGIRNGDIVLREFGRLLKNDSRITDKAYRYGGDEFVIVAMNTTLDNAVKAANRKRELISDTRFRIPGVNEPVSLTVSCGVAELHAGDSDESFLTRGIQAMGIGKSKGNIVSVSPN